MTNITQRIIKKNGRELGIEDYDRKIQNRMIFAGVAALSLAIFGQCFL